MICKVCESVFKDDISELIKEGKSFDFLFLWCKERGFKVSKNTLRNHSEHIGYQGSQIKEKGDVITNLTTSDDDKIINFESYCESIGIKPEYFKDLETHLDKFIYGSQKVLTLIFFKNTAIVDKKLTAVMNNNGAYPTSEIKGLRSIFEMYIRIIGLDVRIDENTALKTLESLGYTISKNINIEN